MQKNIKSIFLVATMIILLAGITAISAADTAEDTTILSDADNSVTADVATPSTTSEYKAMDTTKNIKKDEPTTDHYNSDSIGSDDNSQTNNSPLKTIQPALDKTSSDSTYNTHILEGSYQAIGNTYEKEYNNVKQSTTPISIYFELDEEYELGDSVEVTAMITDLEDESVTGVNVNLYVNENFVTSLVSDGEGWITYDFTPEEEGTYTVTLRVNDENYEADDAEASFNVIHTITPVNLSLGDLAGEIYLGNTLTITGQVTNEETPIPNANVELYINNQLITSNTTNENGIVTYDYTPEQLGNCEVRLHINDENYIAYDTTATVNVINSFEGYELKVETTEFTIGTTSTITASIYNGQAVATDITKGKIYFKINGKTLKDTKGKVIYSNVVNGVATIENYLIPDDWAKEGTTIQAAYSGSSQCDKLTSDKTDITIEKAVPTLTTESLTAAAGEKIQLKASIIDGDKIINSGKVVFKINNKTVKDENGKIIYAKIVNNQVVVNYTLPDDMKAKDYNLTAIFISSDYERLEDTKTLTVN